MESKDWDQTNVFLYMHIDGYSEFLLLWLVKNLMLIIDIIVDLLGRSPDWRARNCKNSYGQELYFKI